MEKLIYCLMLLSFLFCACEKNPEISKDEMRRIVKAANDSLAVCFKSNDAEKVSKMYADSAKLCPDGMDFVHGRTKIKEFWAEDFKTSRTIEMNTNTYTVDGDKDIIYETGKASSLILYKDSIYNVTVKFINVWRLQTDGSYKLDIDFWNRNQR
jgi:ketosteroid isomerase-like protein